MNNNWLGIFYSYNTWHWAGIISLRNHAAWPAPTPVYFPCQGVIIDHHLFADGRIAVLLNAENQLRIEMWRAPLTTETPEHYAATYLSYTIHIENQPEHPQLCWHFTADESELLFAVHEPYERYTVYTVPIYHYLLCDGSLLAYYSLETPPLPLQAIPDTDLSIDPLFPRGYTLQGPGGPYHFKGSEEMRSAGFMEFHPSVDGRYVVLADKKPAAYLISLAESPHRLIATIPLRGQFRACQFVGAEVIIVDSLAGIYHYTIDQ